MAGIGDYIKASIQLDKRRLQNYRNKYNSNKIEGTLIRKCCERSNRILYYHRDSSGKQTYLGKNKRQIIAALQQKRLAKEMIEILKHNIRMKEWFCESILDDDIEAVQNSLPKSYRPDDRIDPPKVRKPFPQSENPFRREDLKIRTSFGLYVRTKSEAQLAELFYSLALEFYYEKALTLEFVDENGYDVRTFYPDFTIILPDGSMIIWEHKGMLSQKRYTRRDIEKEMIYNRNSIYQPHNYMVTSDGPGNQVDMESVKLIVQGWLLPRIAMGVAGFSHKEAKAYGNECRTYNN